MATKRSRIRQHCIPCGHNMRVGPQKCHNTCFGTREGGSLHLTDITQSRSQEAEGAKTSPKSSTGSEIAWVAQTTQGAVNMSLLTSSSTGVRAESLFFPTLRRVKQQCMQCVKQSLAFTEERTKWTARCRWRVFPFCWGGTV